MYYYYNGTFKTNISIASVTCILLLNKRNYTRFTTHVQDTIEQDRESKSPALNKSQGNAVRKIANVHQHA